jgi:uncharacterized protein
VLSLIWQNCYTNYRVRIEPGHVAAHQERSDKTLTKGEISLIGSVISQELIRAILERYTLPWEGIHGVSHWARVLENGRRLSEVTGARREIVELFAVFHDSQRINEGIDDGHGRRGSELARILRGVAYETGDEAFTLLGWACDLHTDGYMDGDVTLRTCWHADRLDLGRVQITPRPEKLCTEGARNPGLFQWAVKRGETFFVPDLVSKEWGLRL